MTKKIFAQPEMMVVDVKRNDIVTGSGPQSLGLDLSSDPSSEAGIIGAPDRFNIWYEGY